MSLPITYLDKEVTPLVFVQAITCIIVLRNKIFMSISHFLFLENH